MNGTLNKVMLIGHLGDDVKIHFFEGGGCIGRFPIATNEVYTNKTSGEKVTNTDWHNVVLRNKAAEICEKYLSKGDKIYIEGRLKTRKWQDRIRKTVIQLRSMLMNLLFLVLKRMNQIQITHHPLPPLICLMILHKMTFHFNKSKP